MINLINTHFNSVNSFKQRLEPVILLKVLPENK